MDPKKLDPKFKEAYERVMGANFSAQPAAPQPVTPQPAAPVQSTPPPPPIPAAQPTGPAPLPIAGQPAPIPQPQPAGFTGQSAGSGVPRKKKGMSPVMIAAGVIIFFLIYTIIWVKIFNLSLPFMSSGTNNPKSGANQTVLPPRAPTPTPTPEPVVPAPNQPSSGNSAATPGGTQVATPSSQ